MKACKKSDIFVNVFMPVAIGYFIYYIAAQIQLPLLLVNYLPDALWSYSFISAILIIWDRKINTFWVAAAFLCAAGFELFQYYKIINGTGDYYDVLIYFFIFAATLFVNKFLTQKQPVNDN